MSNERYRTIQGDTWDLISFKIWGTEKYHEELQEANREHYNTVFFSANVVLKVPEIAENDDRFSPGSD